MAQHYDLMRPGITSISVDGLEHKVDPITGYLVVEMMTPNLTKELGLRGAVLVDPNAKRAGQGVRPAQGTAETAMSHPGTPPMTEPAFTQPGALTPEEEVERQALFLELDAATGSRVDRRRSLPQLRKMKADLPK